MRRRSEEDGAGGGRANAPWLMRQTLVVGVLCVLLNALGAFDRPDRWFVGAVVKLLPAHSRDRAPLLLAVDDATLVELGPLPWSADVWREVAESLGTAGFGEVYLVDPWTRLAAAPAAGGGVAVVPGDGAAVDAGTPAGDAPLSAGAARVRVPRLLLDMPGPGEVPAVLVPPEDIPGLEPWDHQLYLPTDGLGLIADLSSASQLDGGFGPSAFCAWNDGCPDGGPLSVPVRPVGLLGDVPTLSLADVLAARHAPGPGELKGRTVLLGLTAAWHARQVHMGQGASLKTWPEAVASAVAAGRAAPPTPVPGRPLQALMILGVLGLSAGISRFDKGVRGELWLTVLPASVLAAGGATLAAGWVIPPMTAALVAATVPPLVSAGASRRLALEFLRGATLLVIQDAFQYGWRSTRIRSREDLFLRLASLTRNHTRQARVAYLHRVDDGRLELVGGYGLKVEDLRADRLHVNRDPLRTAARRGQGAPVDELFANTGLKGRAVGIRQGRVLVGFWVVAYAEGESAGDSSRLGRLGRWVSAQVALDEAVQTPTMRERLIDQLQSETESVQEQFAIASEERHRQVQTLHALDVPLLTADVTGAVLFTNRALDALLERRGMERVRSIRELAFRLCGEDQLQTGMNQLFVARDVLRLPWHTPEGRTYSIVIRPLFHGRATRDDDLIGYVASIEDRTEANDLGSLRASVLRFADARLQDDLLGARGWVSSLARASDDAEFRDSMGRLAKHLRAVAWSLDDLTEIAGVQVQGNTVVELDLVRLMGEVVHSCEGLASARELQVLWDVPDQAPPARAVPDDVRAALDELFRLACSASSLGGVLRVQVAHYDSAHHVSVSWSGAGVDASLLALCVDDWHSRPEELPEELQPYARIRAKFPDLVLESRPGAGASVKFSVPLARWFDGP